MPKYKAHDIIPVFKVLSDMSKFKFIEKIWEF